MGFIGGNRGRNPPPIASNRTSKGTVRDLRLRIGPKQAPNPSERARPGTPYVPSVV